MINARVNIFFKDQSKYTTTRNIYNLKVIENNIQDVPKNITKFILVGKNRINNPINFYYKTTVLVDKLDTELLNKKIARVDTYNNQFYVDYIGKDKVINKIRQTDRQTDRHT